MVQVAAGRSIVVRVPSSTANLGPGFDSVGLALGLWDEYVVTTGAGRGLTIEVSGEGADEVPTDERHLVHASMCHAWSELGVEPPPDLHITAVNGIPHGRGLGSSATAIVAGVVAAQALSTDFDDVPVGSTVPVDLDLATHLASCLEGHPDNASASVYGGVTVSWMPDGTGRDLGDRTVTARLQLRTDIEVVAFVPEARLPTQIARAVLPASVPLRDAAAGAGRAALLVHALTVDPTHLHAATRDWLHQEARRGSFPTTMRLVDSLRAEGHAAFVSGAGPSVLVLSTVDRVASVTAPVGDWLRLTPGVPMTGAVVTRR